MTSAGVVHGSFYTWNIRDQKDQPATVRRRLSASIQRYRPALIVVGIIKVNQQQSILVEAVTSAAKEAGVPVVERAVEDVRGELLSQSRRRKGDTLAAFLTTNAFPELSSDLALGIDHFQYRRHAWNAAALAHTEFKRAQSRLPGDPPDDLPVSASV